ncbi:hypothetical protein [Clostridium sp.]|uniref:coiled-coil domain-containing protein n=1 Tax=Clostridium sp. TaxID=1506 RepID=UPI00262ADD55|nr:hypothetical protein [Clostridium sp.]
MNKTLQIPITEFSLQDADNPDFLYVKLQCIAEGLNLNDSNFLLDGMEKCKGTFAGKPLLCAFPKDFLSNSYKMGDGHNSELLYDENNDTYYYSYLDSDSERCIGYIPMDSNIQIENINGSNWITMNALIFKKYNYELVQDLLQKNDLPSKISVEIEVTKSYEDNELEYIQEFIGDGVTLLALDGSVLEGIPGANLQLNLKKYSESPKFTRFKQAMNFAYNQDKNNKQIINSNKEVKEVFNNLSMNELRNAVDAILEDYHYDSGNGWDDHLYYIEDITNDFVVVYNQENNKYYQIPYSIDNQFVVSLDMKEITEVKLEYVPINKQQFNKLTRFISKDKLGTTEKLKIDKTKDGMSEDSWSDIDKSELKKDCLMASNYKTVCKAVFLELDDGWMDGKEGSLGYPVMQKKGDTVCYNRYGLASAKAYAEKNNKTDVLAKVNAIYKKLGLNDDQKQDNQKEEKDYMKKYIENAKKEGYAFLGKNNDNLIFAKAEECDNKEISNKEKMSIFTILFEEANKDDKEFAVSDLKEQTLKMSDNDEDEDFAKKVEELSAKNKELEADMAKVVAEKDEMAKKHADLEAKCAKETEEKEALAKKVEDAEKECNAAKEAEEKAKTDKFNAEFSAILNVDDLGLEESDITEIKSMADEGKFNFSLEEVEKEIGFRQFKKRKENSKSTSLNYGLNTNTKINNEPKLTMSDEISKLIEDIK